MFVPDTASLKSSILASLPPHVPLLTSLPKFIDIITTVKIMSSYLSSPIRVFSSAIILRVVFFFYGLWQDANSPMNYTDIDYYVFTDASRFLAHNQSPYDRETYRYTPLLAYLLLPTAWTPILFSFGKALFAISDIITGYLITLVLRSEYQMSQERALKFASIWLLNPMVATISTRGSSEGLLGVMVIALLWAVVKKRIILAGLLLGLAVHFKIYPFIYAPSIVWWMDDEHLGLVKRPAAKDMGALNIKDVTKNFFNWPRMQLAVISLLTFIGLNLAMYSMYVAVSCKLLLVLRVYLSIKEVPTHIYHSLKPSTNGMSKAMDGPSYSTPTSIT